MGSNEEWPPVASPSCGRGPGRSRNNGNKKKDHKQQVLDLVIEMFATTLEPAVIYSLAENCNWELQSTIDALIALSATVEDPLANTNNDNLQKNISNMSNNEVYNDPVITTNEISNEFIEMDQMELKQQLEEFTQFEQLKKNSTKNRMDSFRGNISKLDTSLNDSCRSSKNKSIPSSPWNLINDPNKNDKAQVWQNNDACFSSNLFSQNYQTESHEFSSIPQSPSSNAWKTVKSSLATPITPTQQKISLNQNQSPNTLSECHVPPKRSTNARQLCGLQVHYRSPGTETSSDDDDADVVVEEEFNNYSVPNETKINHAEFSSSSVQISPSCVQSHNAQATTKTALPLIASHKNVYDATLDRIKDAIAKDDKILIILRGLPGSGKTTVAKNIAAMSVSKKDPAAHIFSSDDYFKLNKHGLYIYDPTKISDAHSFNIQRVLKALNSNTSPVIIDNTNLQAWEMRPYAAMAVQRGYYIELLEMNTPWADNVKELAKKNIHGVPKNKISAMQSKYERGISVQTLLKMYSLKYPTDKTSVCNEIINKNDVLTAEDMVVLQNIKQVPNTIHDKVNLHENNMNSDESSNNLLFSYLRELTSDEITRENNQTKVEINGANEVFNEKEKNIKILKEENHLLQPLGAIGSERKNSLVPSEVINLLRDVNINSDRDSKENVLSQCWDFILSLNGKTLHSDHRDEHHFFHNSQESPMTADEMRKQDKEFGKEEQCITMNPKLLTAQTDNLLQIDDKDFSTNSMNEFFEALTKGYNDTNFEPKKSSVIITEIIEDGSYSEIDGPIQQPSKNKSICHYNSNIQKKFCVEKFGGNSVKHLLSGEEMKCVDNDAVEILLTENEIEPEVAELCKMKSSEFTNIKKDEGSINEEPPESFSNTSLDNFPYMVEQSRLKNNIIDDEMSNTEAENINTIQVSTVEIHEEQLDVEKSDKIELSVNYQDVNINNGVVLNANNENLFNETVDHKISINNQIIQCTQLNKLNEEQETIGDIVNLSLMPGDDQKSEKVDNIDRITWTESPFPLDDIPQLIPDRYNNREYVLTADAATNTTYYDFNVAHVGGTSETEYRVIQTYSRHISEGLPLKNPERPPIKLMLDKSSMTGDVFNRDGNPEFENDDENDNRIPKLIELFPHIPPESLTEIYEKLCMKDFAWAVEVLLDGVPNDTSIKVTEETKVSDNEITSERLHLSNESVNLYSVFTNESDSPTRTSPIYIGSVKNEDYQEKCQQYHEYLVNKNSIENDKKCINSVENLSQGPTSQSDDSISIDSKSINDSRTLVDNEKSIESDEIIELNLGCKFVRTLESQFGNPDFHIPDGFRPVISIKKSMAEQLYNLWIESMYQQMNIRHEELDQMIAKDAEFAKSLEQELELSEARGSDSTHSEYSPSSLDEIMDMELALASHKNELKSILDENIRDDMASRLSRQMLHESLPDMDPDTFNDILKAHNGNFKETFNIIESNTGRAITPCDTNKKFTHCNVSEVIQNDGTHANNIDTVKSKSSSTIIVRSDSNYNDKTRYENALVKAANAKQEAQRQFSLRIHNFNKAAEAYRRGYPEVAAYYSQVARKHLKNIETAHSDAASALVEKQIYGDNENTLDLHYLSVTQALQALDEFLDYHLNKLAKSNKSKTSTIYIITGRGARSNNGNSRIKPAVSKRLSAQNLRFSEENPGCLKVYLNRKNGSSD